MRLDEIVEFKRVGEQPVCPTYARGTYLQLHRLLLLSNMKKRVDQIDKSMITVINSRYIDEQLDKHPEPFVSILSLMCGYFVTEYLHHIKMITSENYKFALVAIDIIFLAFSMGGLYGCRYVNKRNQQERRMLNFCYNDLSLNNISDMHDNVLDYILLQISRQ